MTTRSTCPFEIFLNTVHLKVNPSYLSTLLIAFPAQISSCLRKKFSKYSSYLGWQLTREVRVEKTDEYLEVHILKDLFIFGSTA